MMYRIRMFTAIAGIVLTSGGCDGDATAPEQATAERAVPSLTANASTWSVGTQPGDHVLLDGTGLWFNSSAGLQSVLARDGDDFTLSGKRYLYLMSDTAVAVASKKFSVQYPGGDVLSLTAGAAGGAEITTPSLAIVAGTSPSEVMRFYSETSGHGALINGHLRVGVDPTGLSPSLVVSDGGSRFGSNEFSKSSTLATDETALILLHKTTSGTFVAKRVTVGASNSGGLGFRALRVSN